ncbi:MAG: N-acetyl-gamma-glutamyl-phosphate reductase, partial [Actinomycetota bacterium]
MKIGVVGASGYAGGELLRLLAKHPKFELAYIAAGSSAGELITSVHSHLTTFGSQRFAPTSVNEINMCDLVFLALPHGESASLIPSIAPEVKIVDLGADFRLKNESSWKKYYNNSYAGSWLYAIPEIPGKREEIKSATRVANPGCYATAIALAAAPAARAGLIDTGDLVVVAASGTT